MFVTGRAKDVIIRGGHNIDPQLIEEALMQHPGVQMAAAIGAPDEQAGELPMAFVAARPGETLELAALATCANARIPERPAWPKRIVPLPALPMTAVGKVFKPALRAQACALVLNERLADAGLAGAVTLRIEQRAEGRAFADDDTLRVAIVTGAGDQAFCAGGDLARTLPLLTGERAPEDDWDRRLLADPQVLAAAGLRDTVPAKPVIAAIHGACLAAGFELMPGCDLRLCTPQSRFGLPEVRLGLIPFAGALARLPRQVPRALAMGLPLTGEAIGADEALRAGLVNQVVQADGLMREARRLAGVIAANGPLAMRAVLGVVRESDGVPLAQAFECEAAAWAQVRASADAREGPRAFIERRPPGFRGV